MANCNLYLKAKDDDTGENADLKYLIVGGNEEKMFTINEDTGVVTTADKLNYERQSEYVLHVAARNVKPFQGPQASALANPFIKLIIKVTVSNVCFYYIYYFKRNPYRKNLKKLHENTYSETSINRYFSRPNI